MKVFVATRPVDFRNYAEYMIMQSCRSTGEGRQLRESRDKALKQDKRPHRTDSRLLEEDALREEFDDAAQARRPDRADDIAGEDGRSKRKSWKQRAQEKGHRRSRGRGYGMKSDGD
ncbi:MAG: hypothetical protein JJU24_18430 [Natronohydrobacter sp.]|nr:hypothetical protein [Natronohydrobacter sp.]